MTDLLDIFKNDPIFGSTIMHLPVFADHSANASAHFQADYLPLRPIPHLQRAGRAFVRVVSPSSGDEDDEKGASKEASELSYQRIEEIRHRIVKADIDDYYALLDLSDREFLATEEEIKRSYKQISLICHPDKALPEDREDAEVRYKAIQQAYEALSNSTSRVAYDSAIEFDDSIPGPNDGTSGNFDQFKNVFEEVFKRNMRFSRVQPMPEIGEINSPWSAVDKFYEFWRNFRSWREQSHPDEERVGDDASREERRWAARQNEKLRSKLKLEEAARITKLVNRAYKADPRVRQHFKDEEERKLRQMKLAAERRQREKEEAERIQKEFERKAREEIEAKRREENDRRRRETQLESARQRLRNALQSSKPYINDPLLVQSMMLQLDYDLAVALAAFLLPQDKLPFPDDYSFPSENVSESSSEKQNDGSSSRADNEESKLPLPKEFVPLMHKLHLLGRERLETTVKEEAEARARVALEKKLEQEELARRAVWSPAELSMLAKATQKFPVGTTNRWERVAEMICTVGKRTEKEVLKKVKEQELAAQMGSGPVMSSANLAAFKAKMEREQQAMRQFNAKRVAEHEEMKQRTEEISAIKVQAFTSLEEAMAAKSGGKKEKKDKKEKKSKKKDKKEKKDKKSKNDKDSDNESDSESEDEKKEVQAKEKEKEKETASTSDAPQEDVWTAMQQAALEKGLREVPKDAPDRWDQITERVPDKTRAQVVARFKMIREELMKRKANK